MPLARRAQRVEPFHAMAFAERARVLESEGHRVIKLSLGEPDFGAPPAVREAMREVMDGRALPYSPAMGLPELRRAIATFYRERHGVTVDPGRVLITSGASAALVLVLAATVDEDTDVLMADPSYPCNRQLVDTFGGHVVSVATSPATRFQLTADLVERHWTTRTRAVMMATPANPTGTSIPTNELAAICRIARERDAWRIVDEIYLDLADHDEGDHPRRSVLHLDDDAIVINSFSKYFGMTGWRLGWAILPPSLTEVVERLAVNYFLCASTPAQLAALAAFTPDSLAIAESRRRELLERRRVVVDGLRDVGLHVEVEPDGAFYVYVDVTSTGLDAWTFCERALEEAHVALTPGRDFGDVSAATHVRLSYAASRDDLEEGLARVGAFLAARRR